MPVRPALTVDAYKTFVAGLTTSRDGRSGTDSTRSTASEPASRKLMVELATLGGSLAPMYRRFDCWLMASAPGDFASGTVAITVLVLPSIAVNNFCVVLVI